MDKISAMRAFVAVVEEGGFAAAARALGLSRSVVNRQVIQLEDSLKTQLLTRNTRNVAPTETGLSYFGRCQSILADIEAAELALASETDAPSGVLKINAPMSFGTLHLAPCVAEYCQRYPDVEVSLQLDDRFIDPIEDGFDVTVRIANLRDSSLIARKIAPARMALAASPEFVARHGPINEPTDLAALPCLHSGTLAGGAQWTFDGPSGSQTVTVHGRLGSNNGEVMAEAASHSLGVALLPTFIAWPHLRDGRLITLLDDWTPQPIAIHALYPPNRHMAPKVRAFIDLLVERFGKTPYWDCWGK